jgi:tetratricopeptide (TPR) repeat protein
MIGRVLLSRRLLVVLGAVVLTSAYLTARADASLFYYSIVVLHLVLGAIVAVMAGVRLRAATPIHVTISLLLLVASAAFGLFLAVAGATRAHRVELVAHAVLGVAGAAGVAWSMITSATRRSAHGGRLAAIVTVACALAIAVPLWAAVAVERSRAASYRIENPSIVPPAMEHEGGGAGGPFFPSSARTNVGGPIPANFFTTSQMCGRCHADIYAQWSSSAHHFSSFNNQWYRKSIEYMQDVVGTQPSKWCAGCHDHAVFFNGRFDRPIKEQIDTPEAQAGLGCTSCHSIVHVGSTMGQGDFTVEYPPLHDVAASDNRVLQPLHDALLYMAPAPHRTTFLKPFHTEQASEFCSSCHKVHLDRPVNHYRWFRGFNEYDNWQASAASGDGARSFYYPASPQQCSGCHMPQVPSSDPAAKNGRVRSHRFPAANTALPFVNHDAEQLKVTQDFLRDGQVSIDIFALTRSSAPPVASQLSPAEGGPRAATMFAEGEESAASSGPPRGYNVPMPDLVAPLGEAAPVVRAGETVGLDIVVRTRKVGHFFPGGTVDAHDVWVELRVVDGRGRQIFHSGFLDGQDGPVDGGAHMYRSLQLDEQGNVINKRNAWMTRAVAYVRLIPPSAADTVHYRIRIPPDAAGRLTATAKVNYRKFSWWNTHWSYAGIRDPSHTTFSVSPDHDNGRWIFTGDTSRVSGATKSVPALPVTVMAQAQTTFAVAPRESPTPAPVMAVAPSVRERWNDYGIGLLLQGDLAGAARSFRKVAEIDPAYADGWVNIARVELQEGDVIAAERTLRRALGVDARLARTHYFLGVALKGLGRYDEALAEFEIAAAQYPRDRVVLNQKGRVLFLQRRYQDAIATLQRVLAIDAEDVQAHYNLMLSYRGAGDAAAAAGEERLYTRFKADEASQTITGPFRRLNPGDNNERQPVHVHQ